MAGRLFKKKHTRRPRHAQPLLENLESRVLLSGAIHPLAATYPNENGSSAYNNLWHLNKIQAPDAWDISRGNNNVVVAIFDTGMQITHPDLANNVWTNPGEIANNGLDDDANGFTDDVYGWNFVNNNNDISDSVGHGTTVAGVIGAVGNNGAGITGVNWAVDMMVIKVGTAAGVDSQDLIDGLNYVMAMKNRGINVIAVNASYLSFSAPTTSELNTINAAANAGILYVSAAGNNAMNNDIINFIPGYSNVKNKIITVAATTSTDGLAGFSSYGGNSVHLGAPGQDIYTTAAPSAYFTVSGTSFATPMVTAAAALLKAAVPGATSSQIRTAILNNTDALGALSGKTITGGRLNVYRALQSLLGTQAPLGSVDVINSNQVIGWAFDANAGANPINVQLKINGVNYTPVAANQSRPDLVPVFGSGNHGFNFAMPTLAPGSNTIQVYALDNPSGTQTLIGQTTIVNNRAPLGAVDLLNANVISGWAIDQDATPGTTQVRIVIDGGTPVTITANNARPDLNPIFGAGNFGFSYTMPSLTIGLHRADVYVLDSTTGDPTLLTTATFNTNVQPIGFVDVISADQIAGWTYDANAGASPVFVRIDIGSYPPVFLQADASRPDLLAGLGSANHGFAYTLPKLRAGAYNIRVTALDSLNGSLYDLIPQQTLVITDTPSDRLPIGVLDVVNGSTISGWAFDTESGATSVQVRIDIDGETGTPFTANISRPDLAPGLGSADHGFSFNVGSLANGAHRIDLYVINPQTSEAVLVDSKIRRDGTAWTNTPYSAWVDVVNAATVSGWAYSPSAPGTSVNIRLDIDGVFAGFYTANASRPDVVSLTDGNANVGFNFSMPTDIIIPGTRRVTLYMLDPFTLDLYPLYDNNIVFA